MNNEQNTNNAETHQLNKADVSVSFDDEINIELTKRGIYQKIDEDGDFVWDESKLYWARKMFIEGAKWANER